MLDKLSAQYPGQFSMQEMQGVMEAFLVLLPGLFISSMLLGSMISLFLARWWQAVLYNPGGFGEAFRQLRLGRTSAVIATAVLVLTWLAPSDMLNALLMVVFTLYLTQGIAIMHAVFAARKVGRVWLYVVYGLVFMIPHVVVSLAVAGIADAWLDFRRRLQPPGTNAR